ncbi:hypothetical protein PMAYCL1PPCAC_03401, partial [Pristionchus mayeri]
RSASRLIVESLAEEIGAVDGVRVVEYRNNLPCSSVYDLLSAEEFCRNRVIEFPRLLYELENLLASLDNFLSFVHEALHLPQIETRRFALL